MTEGRTEYLGAYCEPVKHGYACLGIVPVLGLQCPERKNNNMTIKHYNVQYLNPASHGNLSRGLGLAAAAAVVAAVEGVSARTGTPRGESRGCDCPGRGIGCTSG